MDGAHTRHGPGDAGRPLRTRWSRWAVRGLLLVALAASLVWVGGRAGGGPQFAGRPASQWFPRVLWRGDIWGTQSTTREVVGPGGVLAMPMLLEAVRPHDGVWSDRYRLLWGQSPGWVQSCLPLWRSDSEIEEEVRRMLRDVVAEDAALKFFYERFEDWPRGIQLESFSWRGRVGNPEFLRAHALKHLATADQALAVEWIRIALRYDLTPSEWERVVRRAMDCNESAWLTSDLPGSISTSLATLGPRAGAAVPWMECWVNGKSPALRALARGTLPAIAPERYPLVSAVMSARGEMTIEDWGAMLDGVRVRATSLTLPWPELGEALASDLDLRLLPNQPMRQGPVGDRLSETRVLARFFDALGTRAGPRVQAALPRMLRRSLAEGDGRALTMTTRAMARFGPVAPAIISEWASGLSNRVAAPSLVLLLASYGPAARVAEAELLEVASGRWPLDAEPVRLAPELMARYGLTQGPGGQRTRYPYRIAERLGLEHVWPRFTNETAAGPIPGLTLPEMAKEALRRLDEPVR